MDTKLILIEGLPGSGKSTTARLVHDILNQNGIEAQVYFEGNLDHPADYESVAFFTNDEWQFLLEEFSAFRDQLSEKSISQDNGFLLPYKKLGPDMPDIFYEKAFKHDIYELQLEKNIQLITQKWATFARQAENSNKVHIFECCFIQNPVTVGMIKYGAPQTKLLDYILALENSVKKLNPMLIYINQDNIEYSFKRAIKERPKSWSEGFIHYYTRQGYGKQNHLSGEEGTIKILKARRQAEEEILKKLTIRKTIINNTAYDEHSHKIALENFLINNPVRKGND
ncbi:hypothetical protein [Cytobacillus firmus]|jgi:hypothetical protein|uniref:Uncharacterized protein n=1 Tax=Cytobacillus firmus TaxID=1399 RepID=A0AA46PYV5_CYTFI|nr:hypothetical protein [Cytobacillus firmus]KML36968.1 hypothetical protein VL14_19600 [Cytobacillus firmus]UYG95860.1 hypothetical protein OD459_02205 [Cytobacillus firmus]